MQKAGNPPIGFAFLAQINSRSISTGTRATVWMRQNRIVCATIPTIRRVR